MRETVLLINFQDDNQRLRGNDFRLRFCWRLILLFLIGNIHLSYSRQVSGRMKPTKE